MAHERGGYDDGQWHGPEYLEAHDAIALAESMPKSIVRDHERPAMLGDAGLNVPAEQVSRPGEQCNCAYHAHPAQSPCGAMTMEQAMEMAKCYACLGLDALTSLGPADLAAEFIRIDRACREAALESAVEDVAMHIDDPQNRAAVRRYFERRLKEIRKEHR